MNRSARMSASLTVASALCGLLAAACVGHQAGPAAIGAAPGAKLPGTASRYDSTAIEELALGQRRRPALTLDPSGLALLP